MPVASRVPADVPLIRCWKTICEPDTCRLLLHCRGSYGSITGVLAEDGRASVPGARECETLGLFGVKDRAVAGLRLVAEMGVCDGAPSAPGRLVAITGGCIGSVPGRWAKDVMPEALTPPGVGGGGGGNG